MTRDSAGVRDSIIETFARWTALSALRTGSPVKSRRDVYAALGSVECGVLFDLSLGSIERDEFDEWHRRAVRSLLAAEPRLVVGWAAKIINVYLKTRAYIAGTGRPNLQRVVHPPIDAGLWEGLATQFKGRPDILDRTHCVNRIKAIRDYDCYERIIDGCRAAAADRDCDLIEVEQWWTGTAIPQRRRAVSAVTR